MNARNAKGEQVSFVPGMWYVGVNVKDDAPMIPANNWHWGAGEIAQYVGENEFYDDGCDDPTDFSVYDYLVECHMGKL
jgi:hypothetical protein